MNSIKREWSQCKICEHYYDEECDKFVKKDCNFKPSNDFIQFLAVNNLQLIQKYNDLQPTLYFTEQDFDLSLIEEDNEKRIDLRNEDINNIISLLRSTKIGKTVFLSISEDVRNLIYNNDWIMKFYFVKMALNKEYATQFTQYKLDQRFDVKYF